MTTSLPPLAANYATALRLIDAAHAEDPKKIPGGGEAGAAEPVPYELHYARQMTRWLGARCPDATPALQLACRAQHFKRWEIPRDTYPMTRAGYLSWRAKQKSQAAAQVAELLRSPEVAPPLAAAEVERVAALIRKEDLRHDAGTQALEDAACLVFLADQFDDFERRDGLDEAKVVGILRKTWAKMSPRGRELALAMPHSDRARMLIGKALET